MQSLSETCERKMHRTSDMQKEREKALEELGICVEKNNVGIHQRRCVVFVSPRPDAVRGNASGGRT
jgi:hypothetical protein